MTNADGRDGKISLQKRRWWTFTDATIRTHNPEVVGSSPTPATKI